MSTAYVEVQYTSPLPEAFKPAFDGALEFWNNVITEGHPGVSFNRETSLSNCQLDFNIPKGDFIRGIRIYSSIAPIDGDLGILGQAGPCLLNGDFPMVGIMMYDSADIELLFGDGDFQAVVVHEMAHIVGLGSLWRIAGLVDNPCGLFSSTCRGDPSYNGVHGQQAFVQLGGDPESKLLVGDERGPGTWDAHWRESEFANELMTGFLDQGMPNPMSILSIKSFIDLGYEVDETMAEEYTLPSKRQRPFNAPKIEIFGDMLAFDLRDYAENAIEEVVEAEDVTSESGHDEFKALFLLILFGFLAMGSLMTYLNNRQNKELERLAMNAPQPQLNGANMLPVRQATKNNMFTE